MFDKLNFVVLYVNDIVISSQFYQDLLGIQAEADSPTFHAFKLSNSMRLGLKAKHSVEPAPTGTNGNGELAFIVDGNEKLDDLFMQWKNKGMHIILPRGPVSYGYTFVALDPDGNRLRVLAPALQD